MSELSGGNIVTTYGKNLWTIQNIFEENVTSRNLSKSLRFAPVPDQEKWRIVAAKDILEVKWNISEITNMETDNGDIDELLNHMCLSCSLILAWASGPRGP